MFSSSHDRVTGNQTSPITERVLPTSKLLKVIKEDIKKWKICWWTGELNMKLVILFPCLPADSTKSLSNSSWLYLLLYVWFFLAKIDKLNFKLLSKCKEPNSQKNLEKKKNEYGDFNHLISKLTKKLQHLISCGSGVRINIHIFQYNYYSLFLLSLLSLWYILYH